MVISALPNLLDMFGDPNGKVREAISWVMARISEHHADIFADDFSLGSSDVVTPESEQQPGR